MKINLSFHNQVIPEFYARSAWQWYCCNSIKIFILTFLFSLHLHPAGTCKAEPIHDAVVNGEFNKVKQYSQNLKNIDVRDSYGRTPLHYAAQEGNLKIAELLISKKADVNACDYYGTTPLHMASAYGNYEMIEFLISKGAKVHLADKEGDTPIFWAVAMGEHKIDEYYTKTEYSYTEIVENNSKTIRKIDDYKKSISILIKNNSNFNSFNLRGKKPVSLAVRGGNNDLFKFFMDNYYKSYLSQTEGKIFLREAVDSELEDIAKTIITYGIEPDAVTIFLPLKKGNIGFTFYLFFSNKTYVAGLCFIIIFAITFVVVIKKSWKTRKKF